MVSGTSAPHDETRVYQLTRNFQASLPAENIPPFNWLPFRLVAERLIRHFVGCCLLFVRILNKLLSVPKRELCFICVELRSWGIYPLWTKTCSKALITQHNLWYQAIGVSCFIPSQFSLRAQQSFVSLRAHQSFVLSVFSFSPPLPPPPHPPCVVLFYVVGRQRGLLGISLAVVYFSFVSLINFSPCQKPNCVLFVLRGVVWGLPWNRGKPARRH